MHGGDPESLVDGDGIGEDFRFCLLECIEDGLRFFFRQGHATGHMRRVRRNRKDRGFVRVHINFHQIEGFELAVERDGKPDDFEFAAILCCLDETMCHAFYPSCEASQL